MKYHYFLHDMHMGLQSLRHRKCRGFRDDATLRFRANFVLLITADPDA